MKSSLPWLSWRLLFSRKTMFGGSAPLALLGLVLGVAALVASMAVMSGFENTLKTAMAEVSGHAQVVKRSRFPDDWKELEERIRKAEPTLVNTSRFVFIEAVLANKGQISGVLIQGVDTQRVNEVLNFKRRIVSGTDDLNVASDVPLALVGKNLAKKMNLSVGETFRVVVPVADSVDPSKFQRRVGAFKVQGILDLGKHDWNERFILSDLKATQELADIGGRYSGLLLKFQDVDHARDAAFNLSAVLGSPYWVRDWRDANENLFEAINVERPGIFFVVLVITIVAAFNVSATLFVNVVRRFKDIAILKTVGLSQKDIMKIFVCQGLFMGLVGLVLGFVLGIGIAYLFEFMQGRLSLISGEVYRLENIELQIRFIDGVAICIATLVICLIATIAPARRGAKLEPVEGLRSE
ncbi:ABC transporter permease [Bdellovibrio bacteriovorus]|uniref:Lipoprotein releasing system transmembrane protein n=1 Tax=Bdellovibrio bacteriovorus str. Tiberius TaxID=1069642 RepID=K7YMX0_BDEBC|nr:ABC transporter permease [Bdellovibrio bacteriovorus]AFY01176.1 lipoprotein releasing system transmembrane protein [Bdellovibrio bacteriovorus str. Tiberius]